MSYGLVLRFEGVTEEQYWQVNEKLGIDRDSKGDWPTALLDHVGGTTADGFIVTEVWASKAEQEAFMGSRLGAALGAVGVPEPVQVIEFDVANHHTSS